MGIFCALHPCAILAIRVYGTVGENGSNFDVTGVQREAEGMLMNYLSAAMHRAKYEILPDDATFYGEIPGFAGVYANASTLEDCREQLEEVLEEWVLFRVSRRLSLPVVDGIELAIKEVA